MTEKYPDCWKMLEDSFITAKESGKLSWSDKCYMPIAATIALTTSEDIPVHEAAQDAGFMATFASWRRHKQIFSFASEMEEMLLEQGEDCEIPVDILFQMPFDCIYIKLQTIDGVDGYFAHIEHDVKTDRFELRLDICASEAGADRNGCFRGIMAVPIHLDKGKTISWGLKEAVREAERVSKQRGDGLFEKTRDFERAYAKVMLEPAYAFVQLLLYICSQNAEIKPDEKQEKIYRQPGKASEIKDRFREVEKFNCGEETAAVVRRYRKSSAAKYSYAGEDSGIGSAKSPHARRGHWHHFWTGPRDGERKLILKWVAPTFIHKDDLSDGVTENIVQEEKEDT